MLNVLLVEDNHNDYILILNALRRHNFEQFSITRVSCLDEAVEVVDDENYDLIISSLNLPDSNSINSICKLGQYTDRFPIIVLTNISDECLAQMAISTGIEDCFVKSYLKDASLLPKTINFSIERHRIKSQLRLARREHEYMATHDAVCDVPNRLLFLDRLNHAIAHSDRCGDRLALLFIDLDDFKAVNDSAGHDAGDYLLSTIARRIQSQVRETDTISRMGGDEFAILLPRCDHALNLDQVLQNIKRAVSAFVLYQGQTLSVTASIGVALYPKDASSRHKLMYYTDLAMFEAKEQGGNRVRYFRESMADGHQRRRRLENELRQAIDKSELSLSYQPIKELADGSLYGFEVMLDWPRLKREGAMSHRETLRAAEDSRQIVRLGHYMIEQLSDDMERLVQSGAQRLLINSNVAMLRHNGFMEALAEIAALWNSFGRVCYVEIAESEAASDLKSVASIVAKLKKYQIKLVLDHFGAGNASLSCLKSIDAVDTVKLDSSYLCDATSTQRDRNILRAIFRLVDDIGLPCIALGVETAEQEACIKTLGCQLAQGSLYAQSMSVCDLPLELANISLLKRRR